MTDRRSAAFLAEMGIGPLWLLRGAEPEAAVPAPQADTVAPAVRAEERVQTMQPERAPAAPQPRQETPGDAGAAAPAADAGASAWDDDAAAMPAAAKDIARMNWAELRTAIAACTRCTACRAGTRPLPGSGPQQGVRWFVAAGAVTAADQKERTPLAGDPGRLLANMLHAAGVARAEEAYVTNLIKCRPTAANGGDRAPTAEEAAACRPFLERELALTGAGVVLTLGQIAANGLLGRPLPEPLSALRGTVHTLEADGRQFPLVPTLHPGELLRRGQDKALAWADLCLLRSADESGRS